MAVNTLAPTGLVWSRNRFGGAPTVQAQIYNITLGYNTAIGLGDLVKTGVAGNQGNIVLSALGDTSGIGVFAGVLPYLDRTVQGVAHGLNGSYPTGTNAYTTIQCRVYSDFLAVFRAQVSGGPWVNSWRGQNINWLTGTNGAPNAAGVSTLALDGTTVGTSNTLPFRIEGLVGVSGGPQDPANTNPLIEVSFNPNWLEAMQGTGI